MRVKGGLGVIGWPSIGFMFNIGIHLQFSFVGVGIGI